jgi:hypothetical protein
VGLCVEIVRALELSMKSRRARSDIALWRRALSALLLASFFWISYVAQTHIHGTPASAATSAIAKSVHLSGKAPSNNRSDGSTDCPLCQAVSLGGALIVPLLFAVLILQLAVQMVPRGTAELRIPASYFACGHQTRAPPIL